MAIHRQMTLEAAGFHQAIDGGEDNPGQQPLDEMIVERQANRCA